MELTDQQRLAYDSMKKMLTLSATLAFPKEGATMYLLADAFDVGWRVVVIQVVECQPGKELYEQTHVLLVCLS